MADLKWSEVFQRTRAQVQASIAGTSLNVPGFYEITDAVGSTKRIHVKALTTSTLCSKALDMTTGTWGTYVIGTDVFTPDPEFKVFKQAINNAAVLTASSVPIAITDCPAPGAGYQWEVVQSSVKYIHVTTAFDTGRKWQIRTDTATAPQMEFTDPGLVATGVQKMHVLEDQVANIIENKGLFFRMNADPTVGDGSFILYGIAQKVAV